MSLLILHPADPNAVLTRNTQNFWTFQSAIFDAIHHRYEDLTEALNGYEQELEKLKSSSSGWFANNHTDQAFKVFIDIDRDLSDYSSYVPIKVYVNLTRSLYLSSRENRDKFIEEINSKFQ